MFIWPISSIQAIYGQLIYIKIRIINVYFFYNNVNTHCGILALIFIRSIQHFLFYQIYIKYYSLSMSLNPTNRLKIIHKRK